MSCVEPYCANAQVGNVTSISLPCSPPPPECCSRINRVKRKCLETHDNINGVSLCLCNSNSNSGSSSTAAVDTSPITSRDEPCACFSFCTASEALDTLNRLPMVTSASSPWHDYLRAVYGGGDIPLPFDLRTLRLFYKDTDEWRQRRPRPAVGLPMASCIGRPRPAEWAHTTITARTYGIRRSTTQPQCAPDVCSRWLSDSAAPLAAFPTQHHLAATHRSHYVELRSLQSAPARPVPAGSWVEVMRQDYSLSSEEGVNGYGCWWFVLPGSGHFVNVGHTAVVTDGSRMAERNVNADALVRSFVSTGHALSELLTPRGEHKELVPQAAHVLGYSSVQVLRRATETPDLEGPNELVVTSRECAHARLPVRACVPIEVRTGARHELPCACNASSTIFNCRGRRPPEAPEETIAPGVGTPATAPGTTANAPPPRTSSRVGGTSSAARRPYVPVHRARPSRPATTATAAATVPAASTVNPHDGCSTPFFLRMPCAGIANDLLVVLRAHAAAADADAPLVLLPAFCEHVPWYSSEVWPIGVPWHWLGTRWQLSDIFAPGLCDHMAPLLHALVRNGSHPPTFGRLVPGRSPTPMYLPLPADCQRPLSDRPASRSNHRRGSAPAPLVASSGNAEAHTPSARLASLATRVLAISPHLLQHGGTRARPPHVAVHLRQGDACVSRARNRSCVHDFSPIAKVLERYQRARRPATPVASSSGSAAQTSGAGTERLRVFLATESAEMIEQATHLLPQVRTIPANRSRSGSGGGRRSGEEINPPARTRLTSDAEWHRAAKHLAHQYPERSVQWRKQLLAGVQHDVEKVTPYDEKAALLQHALAELQALGSATELYIGEFFGGFARLGYVLAGGKLPYVSLDEVAFCCAAACTRSSSNANSFAAWLHGEQDKEVAPWVRADASGLEPPER